MRVNGVCGHGSSCGGQHSDGWPRGRPRGEWLAVTYRFPSAESYCDFRCDCVSGLAARMAPFPAEARQAAWQAVARATETYRGHDGGLTMVNRAYCAVAERGA